MVSGLSLPPASGVVECLLEAIPVSPCARLIVEEGAPLFAAIQNHSLARLVLQHYREVRVWCR